jgi:hypothetical protein
MTRIVCFVILLSIFRPVIARDACENMVSDRRFDLVLKSVKLSSGEGFIGTFELSNAKYDHALVLPGRRIGNTLFMDYPDVSVQFRDLNSQWVSFTELAGSFLTPPDRLEVKPGSRVAITTTLMSPEIANSSGSEFRIMIRLSDPDICVISRPFHAVPMHSPVTGFETSQ